MPTLPDIPITFEHNGKTVSGYLSHVNGAGSSASFHLMIRGRFWGQLFMQQGEWALYLYGAKEKHPQSAWFGEYVVQYLDGL
jgi:hypothetical protein